MHLNRSKNLRMHEYLIQINVSPRAGNNDIGVHTIDGSNWTSNIAPIRLRWNVYFLHIHHNFIFNKGKLRIS